MSNLDAEIFATGKWNGMLFDAGDLASIAASFEKLGDNMRVPLKFGHNDEQTMTDGHPALGWVTKVWVAGDKLMARFTDLPDVVLNAIKKKLYKNVSVELDLDVQYKNDAHPYVLTGVALLGADIPAVNTLKDLTHYMSRDAAFSVGRRAVFSAIAGQSTEQGGNAMDDLKKLTEQVADLTAKVANFTTEKADMSAENADLKARVAKFEADAKERNEADAKLRIDTKRNEIHAIFEAGVKAEAITPAQRTQFEKVLRIADDAALEALDLSDVKALVPDSGKQFSREQGKQGNGEQVVLRADQQVAKEIAEVQAANSSMSFAAAQKVVFDRNPELARAYVQANDDKE